jgi:hypothetical protein
MDRMFAPFNPSYLLQISAMQINTAVLALGCVLQRSLRCCWSHALAHLKVLSLEGTTLYWTPQALICMCAKLGNRGRVRIRVCLFRQQRGVRIYPGACGSQAGTCSNVIEHTLFKNSVRDAARLVGQGYTGNRNTTYVLIRSCRHVLCLIRTPVRYAKVTAPS